MDFELSDDQIEFRRVVRSFADNEIRPVAREMELAGTYPDAIVQRLKEMGLWHDGSRDLRGPRARCRLAQPGVRGAVEGLDGGGRILGTHSLACRISRCTEPRTSASVTCGTSPAAISVRGSPSPRPEPAPTFKASPPGLERVGDEYVDRAARCG